MKDQKSVNELSGWTEAAAKTNCESFITIFGRQPEPGEVETWVSEIRKTAETDIDRSFTDVLVKVGEQWRSERFFPAPCEGWAQYE
ncbi:hypothetical protein SDC9_83482 [bioreactor metagenome]|uniref:Uncharacterized protein n=1 Tax=bioreactor metagenome TaxID=1076179 RepID=A0A644Z9C1_9ZZZZ